MALMRRTEGGAEGELLRIRAERAEAKVGRLETILAQVGKDLADEGYTKWSANLYAQVHGREDADHG